MFDYWKLYPVCLPIPGLVAGSCRIAFGFSDGISGYRILCLYCVSNIAFLIDYDGLFYCWKRSRLVVPLQRFLYRYLLNDDSFVAIIDGMVC